MSNLTQPNSGLPHWWRWVVLAATFYMNAIVNGYAYCFGLVKIPMEEENPEVSPVFLASIAGTISSIYMFLAPIAIAVQEHFGARTTTIAASSFSAFCFVMTWMNGVWFRLGFILDLFTLGICQGIALSFLYGPSVAVLPEYFPLDQIAFAAGVANAGTSFGIIVYGLVTNPLFSVYGWRGTMLFYAAFALQGVLAGLAFVTTSKKKPAGPAGKQEENEMIDKTDEAEAKKTLITTEPAKKNKDSEENAKQPFTAVLRKFFDVKMFSQWEFVMILLAAAFSIMGYFVPTLLVPGQAKYPEYNVNPILAKNLMAIFGVLNLTGRVVIGRLGDLGFKYAIFTSYSLFIGALVVSATILLVFPNLMFLGNAAFLTFVIVYGFTAAPIITMRSVLTINLFGKANASACYGWFLCAQGSLQMIGFMLPAWLNTNIGPFYAYLFAASTFLTAATSCAATGKLYFTTRRQQSEELAKSK